MALERRLFLLAVILLHSMNYTNAVKDEKYIQEVSTGKEIVGDGNCFYRSLSFYLYGHQNEHSTIRENVILYMSGWGSQTEAEKEERSRRYGRLMPNWRHSYIYESENEERSRRYGRLMPNWRHRYEDYLRLHSNNGEWADEPIIQAAADLYGINIYVSSYGNSGVDQLVRATSEQLSRDSLRLVHLRLESSHYTCIEHDCQTDSVPSGDFFELQEVIELGKQNGAKPYEDSLDVLDYNKIVGLPKTVGDGESSNGGIDRFNMEDLKSNIPLINPRKNDHIDSKFDT